MSKPPKTKADEPVQVSPKETQILLGLLKMTLKMQVLGDIVELGCYRGNTSVLFQRIIGTQDQNQKILYLYDSFEGLPNKTKKDNSVAGDQFQVGKLPVTKREVIEKFKRQNLQLPKIKKAFFEDLKPDSDLPPRISFAFLDGDFYSSIKTSFSLIEPKLQKGSIVVVHDYNNPELPGSTRAVDEWLKIHPEEYSSFNVQESLAIIQI